jgi:hypothetical protein
VSGVTTITNLRPFFVTAALISASCLTPTYAQITAAPTEAAPIEADPTEAAPKHIWPPISEPELKELFGPPTLVTLSGQNVPVRDIIAALSRAFGKPLLASPDVVPPSILDKTFSVTWKDLPFWQAAAQVETMTGRRWTVLASAGFQLRPLDSPRGGTSLEGVVAGRTPYFHITAQSIRRAAVSDPPLANDQVTYPRHLIHLNLLAYADPKVPAYGGAVVAWRYQLEKNGEWRVMSAPRPVPALPGTQFTLGLPTELQPGTLVSRLTGTYHAELVREFKTWNVPDILATPTGSETFADLKLSLEDAKFEGDNLKVTFTYRRPETWGFYNFAIIYSLATPGQLDPAIGLKLTDSAGHVLGLPRIAEKYGRDYTTARDIKVTLTFTGTLGGEPIAKGPVSLAWSLPTMIRSVDVPFELKDLVVP